MENKEKILKEYAAADQAGREMLVRIYGAEMFLPNPLDTVKSWEDYCALKSVDPVKCLPFPAPADDEEEGVNAFYQLTKLFSYFRGSWVPDYNDESQLKWFIWWRWNKTSGFGFVDTIYDYSHTVTAVGARLCVQSKSVAEAIGRNSNFVAIFQKLLTVYPENVRTGGAA